MATVCAVTLQSPRPLCFASLHSPKLISQLVSNSYVKCRPPTITSFKTTNGAVSSSRRLVRASAAAAGEYAADAGDFLVISAFSPRLVSLSFSRTSGTRPSWELASTLKEVKGRFDSAGVKLIAVGIGTHNKAQILAQRLPFPMDCLYADPDRKAYDLLGLYYGIGRTFFNPASAKVFSRFEALQKAVKNYTIEATPDDRSSVLQQGGMFVFKGKQLLYAWRDEGTGDHAPLDDVFDICCKVPIA